MSMSERPPCARCGDPAKGFATINDVRYCHDDSRPSCYSKQLWDDSVARSFGELAAGLTARRDDLLE